MWSPMGSEHSTQPSSCPPSNESWPKEEPVKIWPKEEPVDVEMQPVALVNPILQPSPLTDALFASPETWISSLPSKCHLHTRCWTKNCWAKPALGNEPTPCGRRGCHVQLKRQGLWESVSIITSNFFLLILWDLSSATWWHLQGPLPSLWIQLSYSSLKVANGD